MTRKVLDRCHDNRIQRQRGAAREPSLATNQCIDRGLATNFRFKLTNCMERNLSEKLDTGKA